MRGNAEARGRRVSKALVVILAALACAAWPGGSVRAGETSSLQNLFRESVDLYQLGRKADSEKKLREMLALQPSDEQCEEMVREAGPRVVTQMMADPYMGNVPSYLWQRSRESVLKRLADPERIKGLVETVVNKDTPEPARLRAYSDLAELGHRAVPLLTPHLADAQNEETRAHARMALAQMSSRAIPPLLALLAHKDALMRENAILAIGDIRPADRRALPALKARLEDPNETATVKDVAAKVLARITGLRIDEMRPAAVYYELAAHRYLLQSVGVAEEAADALGLIWHLNEAGALQEAKYPLWAWNEQMAEELLLQGMKLHPEHVPFFPLGACLWAAQYTEVKEILDLINEQTGRQLLSEEEKTAIQEMDKKLAACRKLVAACGREQVNQALLDVLHDMEQNPGHPRLPGIAVFLCEALKHLDPRGELLPPPRSAEVRLWPAQLVAGPGALQQFQAFTIDEYGQPVKNVTYSYESNNDKAGQITPAGLLTVGAPDKAPVEITVTASLPDGSKLTAKCQVTNDLRTKEATPSSALADIYVLPPRSGLVIALFCPDLMVQYAAALSLVDINRFPEQWGGSDKVVGRLARGVSENKPLEVLVVDEDANRRLEMKSRITEVGLTMCGAESGRDGLVKARMHPPKELVLISDRLRINLRAEQVIAELRADPRTSGCALSVLYDAEQRTPVQARFGTELPLVERGLQGADLKSALDKVAATRKTDPVSKRKALEVAAACVSALARLDPRYSHFSLDEAVPACVEALVNRPEPIRLAAAELIGSAQGGKMKAASIEKLILVMNDATAPAALRLAALRSLGMIDPEANVDMCLRLQADQDFEVQLRAARNFGLRSRDTKKIYEMLAQERIDREKKEK